MAIVKQSKVIAQLPSVLEPDCLYYVRVGQGFDLYLTDHTGSIAYKSNVDDIVTSNLNRLDKTGRNSVSEELENVIKLCKDNNLPLSSNVQATFLLTRDLNLRELTVDLPNVTFILQHSETVPPKVILGGNSNSAFNPSQVVGKILSSTFSMADLNPRNRNHISCRIIGAKGQNISISQCDYLQLFCSTDIKDRSIAYCNFNFDFTVKLEITTDSNNPDNLELWCNENNFYLKRGYALDVIGSYRHNCNLFIGGGFENRYGYINLESAAKNRFLHTRLEGIGQITFGTNSEGNVIERAYYGSTNSLGIIPVTDNGVMNRISTLSLENSVKTRVFEINEQTPKWNTSVIFPNVLVSEYIKTNKTWSLIYNSPIFKMKGREDYLIADWDNTRARYLIVVEFFDEIGNKIDPAQINFNSPFLIYQANKQWLQGNHLGGQTYGTRNFTIMTPGEYNVKVGIYSNSKLEEQLSKRFTVDLYSNRPIAVPKLEDTLSDIPTQFIGQVGSSVSLLDGRTVSCTGVKSGEVSNFDFSRTEKYITVRNGNTSIKSNAIIEIKNEDGSIVWTRVLKIAGTNSIVLENTEGITNPISYKAFNLEYATLGIGIAYDDTEVKQQLESVIAINRQQEERLDVLAKKSESSSDLLLYFVNEMQGQNFTVVQEDDILKTEIQNLHLKIENGDNQYIHLTIRDHLGNTLLSNKKVETGNLTIENVFTEITPTEIVEKFKFQVFEAKLRFKVHGISLKDTNKGITTISSNFLLDEYIESIPITLPQISFRDNYKTINSIQFSKLDDETKQEYIVWFYKVIDNSGLNAHNHSQPISPKVFSISKIINTDQNNENFFDLDLNVKPMLGADFNIGAEYSQNLFSVNKRSRQVSRNSNSSYSIPNFILSHGGYYHTYYIIEDIENPDNKIERLSAIYSAYEFNTITIPENWSNHIKISYPISPTRYKTEEYDLTVKPTTDIFSEVLSVEEDKKILLPSIQMAGWNDSVAFSILRDKETKSFIKFLHYNYWDSGNLKNYNRLPNYNYGTYYLQGNSSGSSYPPHYRKDLTQINIDSRTLAEELGTFWTYFGYNENVFDENPNAEIIVYAYHVWFKQQTDTYNWNGENITLSYNRLKSIFNQDTGEYIEHNTVCSRNFYENAQIVTKIVITRNEDGRLIGEGSLVSLRELVMYYLENMNRYLGE